jgi:hypothetical protein
VDGAFDFDGADDWASCGDGAVLRPASALTVEAWVYVVAYCDWCAVVSNQWDNGGSESGWWLGSQSAGGPLVFWVHTVSGGWITTGHAVPTGQWTHVAGTYDGSAARLYVGAVEVDSRGASGAIDYDPLPYELFIGRYRDSDEDFRMNVRVDEVRVSSVARSPAWIRASFEGQMDDLVDFGAPETP